MYKKKKISLFLKIFILNENFIIAFKKHNFIKMVIGHFSFSFRYSHKEETNLKS